MNAARHHIAIVGGGPAGLMAAQVLCSSEQARYLDIHVFDAMPTVGRKFLLAGIGGLNLTHSEPPADFVRRYASAAAHIQPMIDAFGADQIRAWAFDLGVETFVGTSGRVFPKDMKAAPLLRAWLSKLRGAGVQFHMRHRWTGWDASTSLTFDTLTGNVCASYDRVILALGGASWPKLGSDGAWLPLLQSKGVSVSALQSANCGFDVKLDEREGWSAHFASRFAGHPLKTVAIAGQRGELVITQTGVEGSLVYAHAVGWRDQITAQGRAVMQLDLLPDFSPERIVREIQHPRGSKSLSSHLKSRLGLDGVKMGLLHELLTKNQLHDPATLSKAVKALPVCLARPRPVSEAISTAGGVRWDAMNAHLALKALPHVFCAGEMLDWEAPTGGYLLTACLASGRWAAQGVLDDLLS